MTLSPFTIDVPDEALDDLRERLVRTRFTGRTGTQPWHGGADPDYLRELVSYWAGSFDWRRREAELNSAPHYLADIAGHRLHFAHLRAERAAGAPVRLPIILSHGWPSCFVEMLPLADRLADPGRYGGDPADARDVVVPSLPGFGYSGLPDAPLTRAVIAETLHGLMTDVLGYWRYGAFGGDIGGAATAWLGALHPDHVAGIHMIHPPFPGALDMESLSPDERAFIAAEEAYDETDRGYSEIMATRPDTVAAALTDSPAGLAAWIVDKFRDWTEGDGDLESRIDRDTLLTIITLYWVTGSIGTSFRQYADYEHNAPRPDVTVPAAFTVSAEPVMQNFPRSFAERTCTDIRHWSVPGKGGHFMPLEEPDLLADEMSAFFASL